MAKDGLANFVVIPSAAGEELRARLTDEEKLAGYLDYRRMQKVKAQQPARLKLAEVKAALALDWPARARFTCSRLSAKGFSFTSIPPPPAPPAAPGCAVPPGSRRRQC